MKKIDINEFLINPFIKISKDWMLITSSNTEEKVNTMTASWGGFGVLWNKNIAFIVLRPQRYTKEFIDSSNEFSLSFFDEQYRNTLAYLGKVSGRNEDKIANSNLHILYENNIPTFEEASIVITCKNLYKQCLSPDCFIDKSLDILNYPNKDYHTLYLAEIISVYTNKSGLK